MAAQENEKGKEKKAEAKIVLFSFVKVGYKYLI